MMKFNEALLKANEVVMKKYPLAAFYEMQGYLVPNDGKVEGKPDVDGTIDEEHTLLVYCIPGTITTITATFDEEQNVVVKKISSPWCEDVIMTPYIGLTADMAIDLVVKELGSDAVSEGPITLRHCLYPGEIEPKYFIGSIHACHSVGVYSGNVDTVNITSTTKFTQTYKA
jgi:hypothetical protein